MGIQNLDLKNNKMKFALYFPKRFTNLEIWKDFHFGIFDFSSTANLKQNFQVPSFDFNSKLKEFFRTVLQNSSLKNYTRRCQNSTKGFLRMFFKIGAFKNFAIFPGKRLCQSLFLIRLQVCRPAQTPYRRSNDQPYLKCIRKY